MLSPHYTIRGAQVWAGGLHNQVNLCELGLRGMGRPAHPDFDGGRGLGEAGLVAGLAARVQRQRLGGGVRAVTRKVGQRELSPHDCAEPVQPLVSSHACLGRRQRRSLGGALELKPADRPLDVRAAHMLPPPPFAVRHFNCGAGGTIMWGLGADIPPMSRAQGGDGGGEHLQNDRVRVRVESIADDLGGKEADDTASKHLGAGPGTADGF